MKGIDDFYFRGDITGSAVSPPPVGSVLFFFATTEEEKLPKEEGRRLTFRRLKSKIMY
jgi:hypothetical protein